MARTYHDAPITAAQMDKVLASMNSVSKASNNGKILCVDDFGFLTAKTQQELHIGAVLEPVTISENGTVTPPEGVDGFDSVTVNVSEPAPVLQNKIVTQNGVVTPDTGYDGLGQVTVDVPGGGYPEPTGTVQIAANGTVNVKDYETAEVNVPGSITAADNGKVVKNGVLVAQTARATEITVNGTYDTTENNSVTVNVSGAGAVVQPLSVTQNGTYNPPSGVDGYAPVTVNVSGGGGGPSNPTTWQTGMVITNDFDALHVGGGSSMSLTKNVDYSVTVSWNGGNQVGAAIYWPILVNVDDIDSIGVKFRATAHYSNSFPVKIGIANAIAGDNVAQSFVAYDSSLDITGEEVTLSVDLQSYTGNYYIIIRADGVSCALYDFAINYAQ